MTRNPPIRRALPPDRLLRLTVPRTVVVAGLIAGAVAGCGAAGSATHRTGQSALPAQCSTRAPTALRPERWAAARGRLAPGGAEAIRLCRYSGLNAKPRLALVSSRLLTRPALVDELVGEFDRLPSFHGTINCPSDDGSQIVARLVYPAGHRVTISVGLAGCLSVTNGSVTRLAAGLGSPPAFGPALVAQLKRLLRAGPVRSAGAAALASGHWTLLARSPLGRRYQASVIWDGRQLLEFGGTAGGPSGGAASDAGAAYDPRSHRWQRIASVPAAVLPDGAASVWTGHQVFVFGAPSLSGRRATGLAGLYDPTLNRWTVSSRAPIGPLDSPAAVWTGRQVILAGMTRGQPRLQVASYDPASGRWTRLAPPLSRRHPPLDVAIVATNDGVLLWSLWSRSVKTGPASARIYSGVDVFRLGRAGVWSNVTGPWPQHETVTQPIFTGRRILIAPGQIWCGSCSHPAPFGAHGYAVDPRTLRVQALPHGPLDDIGPQILWTGAAEISLDTGGEILGPHIHVVPGDIAIWNPITRRWSRGPRAPKQLADMPAVWTGTRLYVLAQDGRLLAYGARAG